MDVSGHFGEWNLLQLTGIKSWGVATPSQGQRHSKMMVSVQNVLWMERQTDRHHAATAAFCNCFANMPENERILGGKWWQASFGALCFGKQGTENRMSSVQSLFSFHNIRTVQHFLFNWTNHFTSHAWLMAPPPRPTTDVTPQQHHSWNFLTDMSLPTAKDKLLSGKYTGI